MRKRPFIVHYFIFATTNNDNEFFTTGRLFTYSNFRISTFLYNEYVFTNMNAIYTISVTKIKLTV